MRVDIIVNIDDKLAQVARHRAMDCGLSLSGWLASLIVREVAVDFGASKDIPRKMCLLDALGDEKLADMDFSPAVVHEMPEAESIDK